MFMKGSLKRFLFFLRCSGCLLLATSIIKMSNVAQVFAIVKLQNPTSFFLSQARAPGSMYEFTLRAPSAPTILCVSSAPFIP